MLTKIQLIFEPKPDSILDVFKLSAKKVNQTPDLSVIVTQAEEEVPKANEIICFENSCNSKNIGFAVFESNDLAFFSVCRIELSPQYPVLWHKYIK